MPQYFTSESSRTILRTKKKTASKSHLRSLNLWPRRRGCRTSCTGGRSRQACTGTGRFLGRTSVRRSRRGSSRRAGRRPRPGDGSGTPECAHTHRRDHYKVHGGQHSCSSAPRAVSDYVTACIKPRFIQHHKRGQWWSGKSSAHSQKNLSSNLHNNIWDNV